MAAVDQCLGERRVELEGSVVGVPGLERAAGPRQRQPAVEVYPCELGSTDGAGREVAGRLEESSLRIVAMAQDKPGPERGNVLAKASFSACSAPSRSPAGETARRQQRQVVAGGRRRSAADRA